MEALPGTDASSIGALAEHLGVTTEDINDWLRQPAGVPQEVLRSWIGLWNVGRLKRS
jgi:hypothetical protein